MIDLWTLWPFPARLSDAAWHFHEKVAGAAEQALDEELTLQHCVYILLSRPGANKAFRAYANGDITLPGRMTSYRPIGLSTLKRVGHLSDWDSDYYDDIRVSRGFVAQAIADYRWACTGGDKDTHWIDNVEAFAVRAEKWSKQVWADAQQYGDWRFYARGLAMMAGLN